MQQKFYKLRHSENEKIIGAYPQVSSFYEVYDKESETSIYHSKWNELPVQKPNMGIMRLQKKAKLTDVLSTFLGMNYVFFSKKIIDIIKQFNLPSNQIVDTNIFSKETIINDYKCFLYESDAIKNLVISECMFEKSKRFTDIPLRVKSLKELKAVDYEAIMDGYIISISKGVATAGILEKDIFNFDFLGGTYLSEKLGDALLEEGITGMELQPVFYEII